ncbi:MAG: tRNA (guanosine(46)-N7)-methyltransferase TrmB [Chromatiales bacterium]|jgi:tRNA (guanine-N7-)-methyltransferase|nr:tRNA (guanosine(46)-N7)-methyltransferase TrmB [Chromatiales bacterium]
MRTVRSFVRREGRMTEAQRRALDLHLEHYEARFDNAACDLDALFGRHALHRIEIGFGMGESLLAMAQANPDVDFLGIEVYRPGVGNFLRALNERGIENVRVLCEDAAEVLAHRIAPASLDAIYLFFPDPWPKKRHHKRRLMSPPFAALVASRLAPGGVMHMATDWENYAQQALTVLSATPGLRNTAENYAPRPEWRTLTRFERRGERLGHGVWDLVFEKVAE